MTMMRLPEIAQTHRKSSPSDLSDAEWEILNLLLPEPKGFGHPVEVEFREILRSFEKFSMAFSMSNALSVSGRYAL
jgi:hypothetical protein